MSPLFIILTVVLGVALLLLMVLKFRINAFIALLITAIFVGIMAGMPPASVLKSIQDGMGSTLGFVATVVGLGAIFGQMLEISGGAKSLSVYLLKKFGPGRSTWALMLSGFLIGIPVFFDVGFIILIPVVYSLSRDSGKSVLLFGLPLLAGLAVTHSLVPPTPGPMAVAQILKVNMGWVILFGILVGLPMAIMGGIVFGRFISSRLPNIRPPFIQELASEDTDTGKKLPGFWTVAFLILLPLLLILTGTFVDLAVKKGSLAQSIFTDVLVFLGHPFSALIIAALSSVLLCIRQKFPMATILDMSNKALMPAGIIILVTGAGGVLKQVLVDSGIGKILAESIAGSDVSLVFLAWMLAAVVRITQGSATVAMITAAGIISPIISEMQISQPMIALLVISIASGATILSHVNDSGF
ncbi:MAG: gluconate:H+ symporter [Bacteroidales bacterium]